MRERLAPGRRAGSDVRLAVIVPVRDGGEDIDRSLAALVAAGQPPAWIHVVDDGSRDGAALAAARRHGAYHAPLADGRCGPAAARNAGARRAAADGADAFLFVDADVVVHAEAIERFRALLEGEPELAAAFGSYDDAPPATGRVSRYKNLLHHRMHQTGARDASTFWSGCGVVRRAPFEAVDGFDERFDDATVEDVDLGLRLTDAGYRIRLCPEILCTHLKDWRLVGWLRTDIVKRALPWSRLLHERARGIPDELNLGWRERVSAGFALLVLSGIILLPFAWRHGLIVAAVSLAAFVVLQRDLLGFFARRHGIGFAVAATLMHVCYLVCSSVVFVGVGLAAWISRRPFSPRP